MTLELQHYIRNNGLAALTEQLSIKVKRHKRYPNLVLCKYSQLDSDKSSTVVQQCRGIILDEENDFTIVSYPYNRFFNVGESCAADVDFAAARVFEKLDGSIITMYFYRDEWHVSSSGLPDASGPVMNTEMTFADLFWSIWEEKGYQLPFKHDQHTCFMFEMMGPYNRIVVRHREGKIALHGARDLKTLKELNPVVKGYNHGWPVAQSHAFDSIEQVLAASKCLDPMEDEGFVVVDNKFNRVKVKSAQYILWSREKDGMSTRRILKSIRDNEGDEFLPKFLEEYNEYIGIYSQILSKYNRLLGEIEGFYSGIEGIDDRKQFASVATTKWYSAALF